MFMGLKNYRVVIKTRGDWFYYSVKAVDEKNAIRLAENMCKKSGCGWRVDKNSIKCMNLV